MRGLTHGEAVTKHCPLINDRCRGDGCMGWQYETDTHEYVATPADEAPAAPEWRLRRAELSGLSVWQRSVKPRERRGHCTFGRTERLVAGVWPPPMWHGPTKRRPCAESG
jgi:hypothetical protein